MSLIGLLGRAGTAFVGGAAQQVNVNYAAKREAEAGAKAAEAKVAAEQKAREAQFKLDQDAARLEQERVDKAEEAKRKRFEEQALREFDAVSKLDTEKVPYFGYNESGYATVKFQELKDEASYLTEEQSRSFAATANPDLAKSGYIQIPVPRDDGKGWKLELKELTDTQQQGQTFKTFAEARDAAEEGLEYYKGLGVKMIPEFAPAAGGIALTYKEASKDSQSQLFPVSKPEDAQTYADNMISWFDSKDETKGKYEAVIETTQEGISVKIQPISDKDKGGVAKSVEGFDLNTSYLLNKSSKAGPDLEKGATREFGVISLTGDPINRFGEEQQSYVEGENHLVFRKNGVGDNKNMIVESHAGFIQEDFTPEVIRTLERNKERVGTVAATRAHDAMVSTFRTFINNFKDANTVVVPGESGAILERDIAELHPWIFELAKESPALMRLLKETPIDPKVPGDAVAMSNPQNMPVQTTPEGHRRPLLPNVDSSPFMMEMEDPGDATIVPMLDPAVVNQMYRYESKSGTDAAELLTVIHSAKDPSTGATTREAIKEAYDNLGKLEKTLADQQFTNEGGYQDPGLGSTTGRQVVEALDVFSSYNDKFIALSTALPSLTIKRAGFNVQLSRNGSRQGKYEAVTGGVMEYKVVGEQLDNADLMKGSINGLRGALKEGGEVGFVLEAESLITGGQYLFDTVISNLEFEEGTDGSKIINGVRSAFEDAKAETDPKKRANALVRVYATMLSYQLARMMDPNGRLSDEDRRTVESAIGLKGVKATPEKLLLVAEQLEEQVDYIQARNRAYSSGNTRMIMAAFTYNNLTGGGNIADVLPRIMSTISDDAGAQTTGGGGATISPAIQRAIDMANRAGSTSSSASTVPATGNTQQVPPAQRPNIPTL